MIDMRSTKNKKEQMSKLCSDAASQIEGLIQ